MMLNKATIPSIGEFTKIPLNLLFAIGVCLIRWHPEDKPRRLQYCLLAVLVFHVFFDVNSMLAYLVFDSLDTSLDKTAYIIYTTFAGNSLVKLACTLLNMDKLRLVLKNFQKYYPITKEHRQESNLDDHLNSIRRYNKGLAVYHFVVTSMFNLFPLMQCIILYYQHENSLFLYELPFPMVYIFNSKSTIGYAFAYVTQCTGSYTASCAFLGSDLLLITCVHLINMNLKYLAKIIREFKPKGTLEDLKMLEQFVIYHNDILR